MAWWSLARPKHRRPLARRRGLAKGDHEDHDDFYHRVERHDTRGNSATSDRWLPSVEDNRLLKRETVARLLTTWELQIQRHVYDALNQIICGGSIEVPIDHPFPGNNPVATLILTLAIVREDDYEADEVELEVIAATASRPRRCRSPAMTTSTPDGSARS